MRVLFLISLICVGVNTSTHAQERVYELYEVDTEPQFPGDKGNFYGFLGANLELGTSDSSCPNFKAIIEFVVDIDGTLNDFKVLKEYCPGLGNEIIKLLRNSPLWKPALKDGKTVATRFVLPLTIHPG